MAKVKMEKVSKARVTFIGNVDVNEVVNSIRSSYPGLEVKVWGKRGKAQKKKTSEVDSAPETT